MAEKEKNVTEVASKQNKPQKEKKKGKFKEFWKGFKSETKKVAWPSWKQVLKNSGIVVVIVLIFSIAIGALDMAFNLGFNALVGLFS